MFSLCSHYAPQLATIAGYSSVVTLISECSIRVFHCKVTVLLE